MMTIAHVRTLLGDALKGANDDARNNKVERLILATTGIGAALEFLAEFEAQGPPDVYNPTRRLWQGADFEIYQRFDSAEKTSGIGTLDKAYAESGAHGFEVFMARATFEDSIIHMARADIKRLQANAATEPADMPPGVDFTIDLVMPLPLHDPTVAEDEIDEDPPELFAVDADDPDGGNGTIPVDDLAGCAVELVAMPPLAYDSKGDLVRE